MPRLYLLLLLLGAVAPSIGNAQTPAEPALTVLHGVVPLPPPPPPPPRPPQVEELYRWRPGHPSERVEYTDPVTRRQVYVEPCQGEAGKRRIVTTHNGKEVKTSCLNTVQVVRQNRKNTTHSLRFIVSNRYGNYHLIDARGNGLALNYRVILPYGEQFMAVRDDRACYLDWNGQQHVLPPSPPRYFRPLVYFGLGGESYAAIVDSSHRILYPPTEYERVRNSRSGQYVFEADRTTIVGADGSVVANLRRGDLLKSSMERFGRYLIRSQADRRNRGVITDEGDTLIAPAYRDVELSWFQWNYKVTDDVGRVGLLSDIGEILLPPSYRSIEYLGKRQILTETYAGPYELYVLPEMRRVAESDLPVKLLKIFTGPEVILCEAKYGGNYLRDADGKRLGQSSFATLYQPARLPFVITAEGEIYRLLDRNLRWHDLPPTLKLAAEPFTAAHVRREEPTLYGIDATGRSYFLTGEGEVRYVD